MNQAQQTVMILEDNEIALFVLKTVLEYNGFRVLECCDSDAALDTALNHEGPICLLISDVILRGQGGLNTYARLRELRPDMPVLFVSGYPLEELQHRGLLGELSAHGRAAFLQKPFSAETLMSAVRPLVRGQERPA